MLMNRTSRHFGGTLSSPQNGVLAGLVPELMILEALPVTVERDVGDWVLYALSVVAAVTAIFAFSIWALELRRRPEIGFHWEFSADGDPAKLAVWPPDYVPEIDPTQPFLVQAAILNTGDKAGSDTLTNFVAPECFDLCQLGRPDAEHLTSKHATAGLPPDYRVVFAAPRAEPWTPGNWYLWQYRLQYSSAKPWDQPLQVRLLFEVSDSRFNSRGRRWLPSLLPPPEPQDASAGTPWPPAPTIPRWRMALRRVRCVHATPRGRVVCSPGARRDTRDLIVVSAKGGQTSVVTPAEEQPAEPR
jgi:hypothetical protein